MSTCSDLGELVGYFESKIERLRQDEQFWLGIAGPPGSGKSTLCGELLRQLGDTAIVLPMDGYHYRRDQLDRMPDPEEAHRRRGAPFTFDAERFVTELAAARTTGQGLFPSFDHTAGDPIEDDIRLIKGQHKMVIVEGNYLLLDDEPWNRLPAFFDETWYLDTDIALCKQRVYQRLIATGCDAPTARQRVAYNDGPNAELVIRVSPRNADRVIRLA
jgi:pantothenate kinase